MKKGIALFIFVFLLATYIRAIASDSIDSGRLIAIPQLGHSGAVFSVVVSSDGQYALSGGDDTNIKLWNLETGHEIRTFSGHTGNVIDLVISKDSKWAASIAQNDFSVRFWDLDTGKPLGVLKHDQPIQSIALSPDERFLLTGGRSLILWNRETKKIEYKYNITSVNSVAFSTNGQQALTGGDDGGVNLLDLKNGNIIKTFGHRKAISEVTFHPTRPIVVSGSYDNTIKLWDINSANLINTLTHDKAVLALSISDDGRYIVSGGKDKKLRVWDLADYSNVALSDTNRVNTVAFVSGKQQVLAGGRNKLLAVWSVESKKKILSLQRHASSEAFLTNISESKIISVSNYNQISYWNTRTGRIIKSNAVDDRGDNFYTSAAAFVDRQDSTKNLIAIGDNGGSVVLIKEGTPIQSSIKHQDAVSSIVFSGNGDQLATGSYDFTAQLWNIKLGGPFGDKVTKGYSFKHNHQVVAVAFSSDGDSILTSSLDNSVTLWDTQTGKELQQWDLSDDDLGLGPSSFLTDFSNGVSLESKDGQYIYFILNGLRRINTETKAMELLANNFEPGEYSIALSPSGKSIVIGKKQPTDFEGSLFLWSTLDNQQLVPIKGFNNPVLGVQFANQGKVILASSFGGLYYFNRESKQQIGILSGSPEGESIFVATDYYFNNTPEGTHEIILRPNNGKDTFSFEQAAYKLYQPDIIQARINGDFSRGIPAPTLSTPPILKFVNNQERANNSNEIEIHVKSQNNTPLKSIFVYVNGRSVINKAVDKKVANHKFSIPLFNQMNRVTVVGFGENGMSSNPIYRDVVSSHDQKKSTLYIIGVGISKYPNLHESLQLKFAHSDVEQLTRTFENKIGPTYGTVNKRVLVDLKANKQGIKEALNTLKGMKQHDMAIIHLAGHGISAHNNDFYFLTSEVTDSQYSTVTSSYNNNNKEAININELNQYGMIDWAFFKRVFSTMKGQAILFLDACHSADLVKETITPNDDLANRLWSQQSGGIIIFSAAKGRQAAEEPEQNGPGYFTNSIITALNKPGIVDSNQNNYIELMELVEFVRNDVSIRSNGAQTPWLTHKTMFGDLILMKADSL